MILLDTDILIDVALDRQPHSAPAADLLERIRNGGEDACVAWHTISNFYYVTRRDIDADSRRDFILDLIGFVSMAVTDTESVRYAARLPMSDFEDALQAAAARACRARFIITRNIADYRQSPIPAIAPERALDQLARGPNIP